MNIRAINPNEHLQTQKANYPCWREPMARVYQE